MTYDEKMVELWKALPDVQTICGGRVYHLEVFQKNPSLAQFPCVVYQLESDLPELELSQPTGVYYATYSLMAFSKKSSDTRTLATAFATMAEEAYIQVVAGGFGTTGAFPDIGWIDVIEDTDLNEFAQEQQDKGYRASHVLMKVTHQGK